LDEKEERLICKDDKEKGFDQLAGKTRRFEGNDLRISTLDTLLKGLYERNYSSRGN
jgi:hypothetical protein